MRYRTPSSEMWRSGKRKCSACKEYQSPESYGSNKDSKDGLSYSCRDCAADNQRRIKYGITSAQYNKMLADQGGRCAVCGSLGCQSGKKLAVDHDHGCCPGKKSCGQCIRKLLCQKCNQALGLFGDDPDLLRKAAGYIEENNDYQGH